MTWTVYNQDSVGAPSLVSVNGSLNTLLRWALPLLGWAVEYGATGNASVFRAASGNRFRLNVRHDSAVSGSNGLAYVRGAHTASSATTIGTPFPTATQVTNANSNWRVGYDPADTVTPCRWIIAGNETFFYLFTDSQYYDWEMHFFGDVPSNYATGYESVVLSRNTVFGASPSIYASASDVPSYDNQIYWARGINAITVSTKGIKAGPRYGLGIISTAPVMRAGYLNRLLREKIGIHDWGSSTDTGSSFQIPIRGWLPNLWNPLHSGVGGLSDGDTFTDTVYNAAATFQLISSASYGSAILETSDTWVKP